MPNRTILVTGSARGIGGATAAYLESQGHRVIGLDIENATVEADLSTPEGRAQALAAVDRASDGRLDAIIACAGLAAAPPDLVIAVNYFGVTKMIVGLRDLLVRGNYPRVVAISSAAVLNEKNPAVIEACLADDEEQAKAHVGSQPGVIYASSKVALSRWIRRTAPHVDWAGSGILMNAVAPGTVNTRITQPILAEEAGRAMLNEVMPLAVKAIAEPADLAPLLAFLASPENRYMVGQTIFSDGGSEVLRRGDDIFQT